MCVRTRARAKSEWKLSQTKIRRDSTFSGCAKVIDCALALFKILTNRLISLTLNKKIFLSIFFLSTMHFSDDATYAQQCLILENACWNFIFEIRFDMLISHKFYHERLGTVIAMCCGEHGLC